MELLLIVLFEIVVEVVFELLVSLGLDALAQALGYKRTGRPRLALLGCLLLGFIFGALSVVVHAERLISNDALAVSALALNSVLVGLALAQVGRSRERRGGTVTALSTFWGGFSFALAFSGARLVWSFL